MDLLTGQPGTSSSLQGVTLDADTLCQLLARLDADGLPASAAVFPSNGPQIQPLFRGANAELLLIRWAAGQATDVADLGDSAMAVRPLEGELELLSFSVQGRRTAQLEQAVTLLPGQLAGVPTGAIHALRARRESLTLHLCAPPVIWRAHFESSWA